MADDEIANKLYDRLLESEKRIIQRFDAHEKFVEKRLDWQDRMAVRTERRMESLETATNHKVDLLSKKIEDNLPTTYATAFLTNKWVQGILATLFLTAGSLLTANGKLSRLAQVIEGFFN